MTSLIASMQKDKKLDVAASEKLRDQIPSDLIPIYDGAMKTLRKAYGVMEGRTTEGIPNDGKVHKIYIPGKGLMDATQGK